MAVAGAQELPLQVPRREREGHSGLLALLGASVVVFSVVGKPPVHAGFGLAGFLLWLMGVARLVLFGQIARSPAALAAATARLAVDKLKHLFCGRQAPAAAPA